MSDKQQQPAAEGRRVVFFDLDGTLHQEDMFGSFLRFLLRRLPLNLLLVIPVLPPIGLALLLAVIAGGLWQAWRKQQDGRYGLAIFIYALIFMASQGMFIISNPRESWSLFWLPLGIALSGSLKAKR